MRYVRLGSSGLKVSRIGLGMMSYGDPASIAWSLPEDAAAPIVRRAVEAGVTLFDTADMYSAGASEEITGRLLARFFPRRDDYVLATKVYYPMGTGANDRGLSRKHIMDSVTASLRRLGTDHIDLYQIHRWDSGTPIDETIAALDDVVRSGKVRYVGASLMRAWQFAKATTAGPTRFVSMQTRYSLLYREEEREMIPLCLDQGVGVLAYSPLARGALARVGTSTRSAGDQTAEEDTGILDALRGVAANHGVPPARAALAWVLGQPAVTAPIIGATKASHLDDAVAALDVSLDDEDRARLEAPYRPRIPYGYG
jgi:1-deoxyxylulose-5-phosphate synthase